jgi:hypothetical protein
MFIFFVFCVFWSLLWFHCNLFTSSNFQMGHFYYQCWFLQTTWKDLTSLAIRYEKISPEICVIFSLSQMDLLSGNYLVLVVALYDWPLSKYAWQFILWNAWRWVFLLFIVQCLSHKVVFNHGVNLNLNCFGYNLDPILIFHHGMHSYDIVKMAYDSFGGRMIRAS